MINDGLRILMQIVLFILFVVATLWVTSCVDKRVNDGVRRHTLLVANNCYESVPLEDGGYYLTIHGGDLCQEIFTGKSMEGDENE